MFSVERGLDDTWSDAIDSDTEFLLQRPERVDQRADGVFGGEIQRCGDEGELAGDAADVDDAFWVGRTGSGASVRGEEVL